MPQSDGIIRGVLETIGVEPTATHIVQMGHMTHAFMKFVKRDKDHNEAWKDSDVVDKVHHLRSKLIRMAKVTQTVVHENREPTEEEMEIFMDSADDMITYAVFAKRLAANGRWDTALEDSFMDGDER